MSCDKVQNGENVADKKLAFNKLYRHMHVQKETTHAVSCIVFKQSFKSFLTQASK